MLTLKIHNFRIQLNKIYNFKLIIKVLLFLSLLIGGCSTSPTKQTYQIFWPSDPENARIKYEVTLRNQASLNEVSIEKRLRNAALGEASSNQQGLIKPYDVVALKGLVAVSDSLLGTVHVFDITRKKMFAIGWRGKGQLKKPVGLGMDAQQNIYVADAALGMVVKFDPRGHFLSKIGNKSEFSRVIDVAVGPQTQRVYVLDRGGIDSSKHQISVFTNDGDFIRTIGNRGHGDGEFNHPIQIAIDKQEQLYVLDAGNFRVQVFDNNGQFLFNWGRLGKALGNLARPRGIAVDGLSRVYISDAAFQNFQIFTKAGELLINVGSGGGEDLPGQYLLPAGIAVDESGKIFLVDQIRRKVDVFSLLDYDGK